MPINRNEINAGMNEGVFLLASAEAPDAPAEAVDMATLTSLEEAQTDGEADLVVELIDLYLEDAAAKMGGLREALAKSDETMLRRLAHCLRGSSGNLGARRMAALCAELEHIDSDDVLQKAEGLLLSLEQEFEHVGATLAAERQRRA